MSVKRIDVKTHQKKKDGLGVGFLIGAAILGGIAYWVAGSSLVTSLPLSAERALKTYRAQIDQTADDMLRNFSGVYISIAGR